MAGCPAARREEVRSPTAHLPVVSQPVHPISEKLGPPLCCPAGSALWYELRGVSQAGSSSPVTQ